MDPIPAGKYLAMITASEMKPNKAGTGQFLELSSRSSKASTRTGSSGRG